MTTEATALQRPTFVIKVGEKYYATLAVWEYDPGEANLTPEQKRDIEDLGRLFEQTRAAGPVFEALELASRKVFCFGASKTGSGRRV